jgi:AcrR family transcriptional regulator
MKPEKTARKNHDAMTHRILAAATTIVETQGFNKLSARSLAQALNLSVGTIYNYFVDFNELTLHINSETIVWLDRALMSSVTPKTKNVPMCLVDAYFDFLENHPERWRALFMHYPPKDFELPHWYIEIVDQVVQHVRDLLFPYLTGYSKNESRDITVGLWAALHGLSMLDQQGKLKTVSSERGVRDIAHTLVEATTRKVNLHR